MILSSEETFLQFQSVHWPLSRQHFPSKLSVAFNKFCELIAAFVEIDDSFALRVQKLNAIKLVNEKCFCRRYEARFFRPPEIYYRLDEIV
jgi:hypothetical protein